MLLFATCHCAVLFRSRTNKKAPACLLLFFPNRLNTGSSGPVGAPTTGINFTAASPPDQIQARLTCTHPLETHSSLSGEYSEEPGGVTTSLGVGGFPHDKMQWRNFSFMKLFPVRLKQRMLWFGNIFVIERENKCL